MDVRIKKLSVNSGLPKFPGGRYRTDGPRSGQAFREDALVPALLDESGCARVTVVFDGVAGFSSSFLEEAFGGLVREHRLTREFLRHRLDIATSDDALKEYVFDAKEYIERALVSEEGDKR